MSNPLFREPSDSPKKPIRIGGHLFEKMPEASQDPEVYKALSGVRERPFPNSDDIADEFMGAMKVSTVLTGQQKKRILQAIIRGQLVFSRVKRDIILQYSVDIIEKEIEPKALAFVFLIQEIYYRNPPEQGPFLAGLKRCYHAMDDESRQYIGEELLAQQGNPSMRDRTITIGDQEARLDILTRAQITEILVPEARVPVQGAIHRIGQRLLRLLSGVKKE